MTLEAAYNAAGPKIVGYLVVTGTDEGTARDLLHDAVVGVSKWLVEKSAKGEDRSVEDLSALLFTAARNLRANRVRHDSRIDFVGEVRDGCLRHDSIGQGLQSATLDAAYLRSRIVAALRELPETQREAYVLYQVGGRSVREVSEMTGASESLVKVRLHRAKMSLRKSLADWKEK